MLLGFSFQNHRSFRDEQTLSMLSANYLDNSDAVVRIKGLNDGVLPVAAIYGANASGKSNALHALDFLRDAVLNSHRMWEPDAGVPVDPFVGATAAPTSFCVDFELSGVRHQFGFSATAEAIHKEWLHVYPHGKRRIWYERSPDNIMKFGPGLQGSKRSILSIMRRNSLFLSVAAQNAQPALMPIHGWITRSLLIAFASSSHILNVYARRFSRQIHQRGVQKSLVELMKAADLGIEELSIVEEPINPKTADLIGYLMKSFEKEQPDAPAFEVPASHFEVRFTHHGGHEFKPEQESDGTMSYFALLGPILDTIERGGTLCVDELDSSLHPTLAAQLVRLFQDPAINTNRAQLIFNTHDTSLLACAGLRRDQVWFCEKAQDGASTLYPLSDFKPRKGENIAAGYLQGRYGAIPFLNEDRFLRAMNFESGNEK